MSTPSSRRAAVIESPMGRWERMVEIRCFEDEVAALFAAGEIRGTTHTCQGQEAVSVALAACTTEADWFAGTYRGHGLALALGADPDTALAEIMGRAHGSMLGLGGSMHLSAPEVGLLPTSAIIGAGLPIAVGAALTAKMRANPYLAVAVFGDGATNIGAFHESLNLAAIWNLPVVFVIENNLYGEYSPLALTTPISDLSTRAESYGMNRVVVDGQDCEGMIEVLAPLFAGVREDSAPLLVEAKTYRYAGHSRTDPGAYRPEGELEAWRQRDPIAISAERLETSGAARRSDLDLRRESVRAEVQQLVERVRRAPTPQRRDMFRNIGGGWGIE